MIKKIAVLLTLISLFMAVVLFAADENTGLKLFFSKCGKCHKSGGDAEPFAPAKYARKQWIRFFELNKHQRKKDLSLIISEKEMKEIKDYLKNSAADSPYPEAAGLE